MGVVVAWDCGVDKRVVLIVKDISFFYIVSLKQNSLYLCCLYWWMIICCHFAFLIIIFFIYPYLFSFQKCCHAVTFHISELSCLNTSLPSFHFLIFVFLTSLLTCFATPEKTNIYRQPLKSADFDHSLIFLGV